MSVDALSATNSAPSDAEIKQLSDLIAAGADDFTKATQDLESATRRVNALERELGRETRQYGILKGIASPLRRLPPELVAELFHCCMDPASAFVHPNPLEAPLLLCQISSMWRDIALSSSKLWSRLELDLSPENYCSKCELAALWLERAGSVPVALSVQLDVDDASVDPIKDLVALHATKMRRLHLSVPARCIEDCLELPRGLFERLDTLAWTRTDDEEVDLEVWTQLKDTSSLDGAPRLATLTLQGEECHLDPRTVTAPWAQLTSLTMSTSTTKSETLALLSMCPALVELSVGLKSFTDSRSIVDPSTTHHHLRSLQLTVLYDPQDLMDLLTLPVLEQFTIVGGRVGGGPHWVPSQALPPLIARSDCALTALVIRGMEVRFVEDLIHCLNTLRELRSFTVEFAPYATSFFWKALSLRNPIEPGVDSVLPCLRRLRVQSRMDRSSEEALMGMIESRRQYGQPSQLDNVHLNLRGEKPSEQTLQRVSLLKDSGFAIELVHTNLVV